MGTSNYGIPVTVSYTDILAVHILNFPLAATTGLEVDNARLGIEADIVCCRIGIGFIYALGLDVDKQSFGAFSKCILSIRFRCELCPTRGCA